MVLSVLFLVVFFAAVHLNSCSTIITRGMIRTETQPGPQSQGQTPQITLPDPEKLTLTSGNVHKKYQMIFPSSADEERTDFKRVLKDQDVLTNHTASEVIHAFDAGSGQGGSEIDNVLKEKSNVDEVENTTSSQNVSKHSLNDSEIGPTTSSSPREISKLYWESYKNLSSDYFERFYRQNFNSVDGGKGFSDFSLWEIIQRFYTCTLTIEIGPCLQETFSVVSSDTSFLQFLSQRLPRFELEEGQLDDNVRNGGQEIRAQETDQDEGRKRTKRLQVFQTLQFLLPLLLAVKMSMLPALAIMVLVTGKAFFMSVLSLGAAIFSFFLQTPGLAANKRQEVASQMPPPLGPDPSKYYYVM